jgi:vacuolar-type H+-ATPase subunit F/Vma7
MTVRVLMRPSLAVGVELAGLLVEQAPDGRAAADIVTRWAADEDVGVVLVDDELYKALPGDLLRRLDRQAVPVVASVPVPRWDERSDAEAFILEILRQAIGYRVRPR